MSLRVNHPACLFGYEGEFGRVLTDKLLITKVEQYSKMDWMMLLYRSNRRMRCNVYKLMDGRQSLMASLVNLCWSKLRLLSSVMPR